MVCAQIGARDHYAFPRAFHRQGLLHGLITDYWHRPLPGLTECLTDRLSGRGHPDLAGVPVMSQNLRSLAREGYYRLRGLGGWDGIMLRNEAFQAQAVKSIIRLAEAPDAPERVTLFAYSYAARELFRVAASYGWRTILGQIDPGPVESRLVDQISRSWPDYPVMRPSPPAEYFARWHEELELADRIVVNSEWSWEALAEEGAAPSKMRVVPIPYEEEIPAGTKDYPDAFSHARPLRLLFLGQVNLRKGVAELLEAMAMLESSPVELWIVGGKHIQLPERIERLSSIRWFGQVAREDVGRFFRESDLFVFPTHSDGFGLTQLEAMACRLPVLATTRCAHLVDEGVNGMVLGEITPTEIVGAIHRMIGTPGLLAKWSEACRIPESCRMDQVGGRLRELVGELFPDHGAP